MRNGLILLPVVTYILFALAFYRGTGVKDGLKALVKGHIVFFIVIAISTELLSSLNLLALQPILAIWLLFLLIGAGAATRFLKESRLSLPVIQAPSLITFILVSAIVLILLTTFVTAIVYPPNTWDSMTYHMPRVLHWINNNNLSFYPTEISRQNYQMPLAEFVIMHLQILTDGDWYANIVQWVSFLVLICLGALVADELGLDDRSQLITATIIATLPMAILQSSSTQNDLVVSVFLMSFSFFMLRLRSSFCIQNLFFAASSLGLALLTKGTAYLFAAMLGIFLSVPLLINRRQSRSGLLETSAALGLVVVFALALNTGHLWRNYQLHLSPLSTEGESYFNEDISVETLASNILRNGSLHLGTASEQINILQMDFMRYLLGDKLNDPKTTWSDTSFSVFHMNHEDVAGNIIHMLVTVVSVLMLFLFWFQRRWRGTFWYSMGVLSAVILFCLALKWQPWASRLHTPLFVLVAPLIAITITSGAKPKQSSLIVSLLMIFYCLPYALNNSSRSLVSLEWKNTDRRQLYFQNRPYLFKNYNCVDNILSKEGAGEVGLYMGKDDWEYPFWALANQRNVNEGNIAFQSVGVSNASRTTNGNVFLPPYVIATKSIDRWPYASMYMSIYNCNRVSVFRFAGD